VLENPPWILGVPGLEAFPDEVDAIDSHSTGGSYLITSRREA
jgi:hypothetical protein